MKQHITTFCNHYQSLIAQIPLPGELTNDYEILDCLRETLHKSTYLVRSRGSQELYILKTASASCMEDIKAEYQLLKGLSHPCIPRAILYLARDDKRYLVREYVAGTTLAQSIDEDGPMTAREAAKITVQLCGVLQYLHSRRPPVIHRDIKPQNIILTPGSQ